jgi:hypothetical protein
MRVPLQLLQSKHPGLSQWFGLAGIAALDAKRFPGWSAMPGHVHHRRHRDWCRSVSVITSRAPQIRNLSEHDQWE